MPQLIAEGQSSSGSSLGMLLLIVPVVMIGWMMFSQSRRRKALDSARSQLNVGSQVRTTSGIFGVVIALDDETADVEIAPGVTIKIDRRAVLPQGFDAVTGRASATEAGETQE